MRCYELKKCSECAKKATCGFPEVPEGVYHFKPAGPVNLDSLKYHAKDWGSRV